MNYLSFLERFVPGRLKDNIKAPLNHELNIAREMLANMSGGYSQEGEDLILTRIISGIKYGTYIDIGAHHPYRFSNTFLLYQSGWRGVNIDANPWSIEQFNKYRPDDINVNVGVDDREGSLEYFKFDEPAINTFDFNRAKEIQETRRYKLIEKIVVPTMSFDNLYSKYAHIFSKAHLLTIDVEGFDLKILGSINWKIFKPKIVIVESDALCVHQCLDEKVHKLLTANKYYLFSKLYKSRIYITEEIAKCL